MPDRTINWGDPSDPGTTYQTGDDDPAGGGNFVVARDTDGGVTLLEYDATADEWVSRGDVNLNGNDLSANAIDAASVSAETLLGADVANSAENQILVAQGDGTLAVETQAQGPNPYDEAQSFAESGVSVSTTNTILNNGSISLAGEDIVADFEDGTAAPTDPAWSNWNYAGTVTAQQNTVISGDYSAEIAAGGSESDNAEITRDSAKSTNFSLAVNLPIDPGNAGGDPMDIRIYNGSGNLIYIVRFDSSGEVTINFSQGVLLDTWSAGTYEIEFSWDFANNEADILVDGVNEGTFAFDNNSSGFQEIEIGWNTVISGSGKSVFVDDITEAPAKTDGSVIVEWDRGVPTDIFEWDVATFTESPDGETVDVFVAYSDDGGSSWTRTNSGNPISRNYSLGDDANITPDVDVRIESELSRADTANNPSLDSAYRSWLV